MDELEALNLLLRGKQYKDLYPDSVNRSPAGYSDAMNSVTNYTPVSKQPPVSIEAPPLVQAPIEFIQPREGKRYQPAESIRKNINLGLSDISESQSGLSKSKMDVLKEQEAIKNIQRGYIDLAMPQYQEDPELKKKIAAAGEEIAKNKLPERSLWAEAILSLGPALLGKAIGGAGAEAAVLPTMTGARAQYEAQYKDALAAAKENRANLKIMYDALMKQKQEGRVAFDKQIEEKLKELSLKQKAAGDLGTMNLKQLENTNKELWKGQEDLRKMFEKGTLATAEMEHKGEALRVQAERKPISAKLSPGQAQLDREFAKKYAEFSSEGGYSKTVKNLTQLNDVLSKLDKGVGTGLQGQVPKVVRDTLFPEGAAMQEKVEQVITETLKQTFGAQFTEKEGKGFMERAYNPKLPPKENAARLRLVIDEIKTRAKQIQDAGSYFEKSGGTLSGYKVSGEIKKATEKGAKAEMPKPPPMTEKLQKLTELYKTNKITKEQFERIKKQQGL